MAGDSVGRVALDLGLNYGSFNRELNSIAGTATGMVGAAFGKLGLTIAAAFGIRQLIRFGDGAIELASNLSEVQNVVDVTFGSMSNQINDFANNALNKFGLSELSAKKFSSTMGAMLKSSGLTGQALVDMSEGVTGLAGDMASFYNLGTEEAFTKIRAGLAGETEPLKQLGVNMSVANLEAYALAKGITKSYQSMSQAEQTLLRYNYLLSVTKDAQGDFARTSNSWANQTRLLKEQWKIFQGTLGAGFINVLTPVIGALNTLIAKLQVAAQYFKAFTEMIFGSASAAGTSSKAITASMDTMAQSSDDAGDSLGGVGDAAKKAGKDIKGSLSSFDELNIIGQQASGSLDDLADAGAGAGGIIATPTLDVATPDTSGMITALQPLKDVLDAIIKPLQSINFEPLVAAFDRLKTAIEPLGVQLFEGLRWAYSNVLIPLASFTISELLPAFLDVLSGAFRLLNPLLDTFKPLGMWLWNTFLVPIASYTGGVIASVLKELAEGLTKVGDWVSDNKESILTMTGIVAGFFAAWKLVEVMAFVQMSGGIVSAFSLVTGAIVTNTLAMGRQAAAAVISKLETMALTAMYAVDFVVGIGKATAAIIVNAAETVYLGFLYGVEMVANIGKSIVALAFQAVQWGINTAATIANKLALAATTVAQIAMTVATGAWSVACGIATGVTTAFGVAVGILTSPITLVIAAIALLGVGIYELVKNWDTVKEVASNVWDGVQKTWKMAAGWFGSNVVDPIKGLFKGLWGGIIDGMNFVVRGLNKISFDIPDWVPGIGGNSFGISIPEIPKLAKGGMVSAPTLAMVGDNRSANVDPEVISPLSKLQGMIGASNQGMVEVLFMILEAIENLNLSVDMDGEKVTRIIREKMFSEDNRVGKAQVTLGGMPV